MNGFVKRISDHKDMVHMQGASEEEIETAETALGLQFAPEYKEYVKTYGAASFGRFEFTGVCSSQRLNVVLVTAEERNRFADVDRAWYVVEQTGNDGAVIWQDKTGKVYCTVKGGNTKQISNSLSEYIDM